MSDVSRRQVVELFGGAAALATLAAACSRHDPEATPAPAPGPQAQAPATRPEMSRGKPPSPADFMTLSPAAPFRPGRVVDVTLVAREGDGERIQIAPDRSYSSMNFDGQVPGPTLRVTEGDRVRTTLVNQGMLAHSIDIHAARTPWSTSYRSIPPGERLTFEWTAEHAGVFMYHCGTEPAIMHIADGMYGAVIVAPRRPRPPARELVIVQGEFYGGGHDTAAMLDGAPVVVAFNGAAFRYRDQPIAVRRGELVRFFVVVAGPNHACAFHVVGGLFHHVELDGNPDNAMGIRQTVDIPPGGGAMCEIVFDEPGSYPFMSHRFADATRGAMGMLEVT